MAHPPPPTASRQHRRALTVRILMGVVYLLALGSLIVWEYRDRFEVISSACDLREGSTFWAAPYRRMLGWASGESESHVTVVAIPEGLEDIQSNLCEAREYMADVLRAVATRHPAEVVLDKFYSPSACSTSPRATEELLNAVRGMGMPVVIGESSDRTSEEHDRACLVRKPQLNFMTDNVRHGLTRLNIETEKMPLMWRVLPSTEENARASAADSLAWAAVKAYDPDFVQRPRLRRLLASGLQPYAKLSTTLPRISSTDLLCTAGTDAMKKRWGVACTGTAKAAPLLGRIVVIGSEQDPDRREILGAPMWGFDLQARYIDALLSGSYLRAVPFWVAFALFGGFVFFIEGLPTLLEVFRPGWKKRRFLASAFERRRYGWVIFWALGFMFITTVLCLAMGYLPPLAVFGDIALVAVTRLLFFAAETFEHPLVHSHSHASHTHAHTKGKP